MKKILFAVMAVAAISFSSCGNKTQQAEATADSIAAEVTTADEEADAAVASLAANLAETSDPSKFQTAFEEVKTRIANLVKENPEAAKQYVARIQGFLKENADKIKALVGENAAVSAAISAISDVEPDAVVSGLLEQVGDAAADAKDAAVDAANQAVDDAKQAVEDKANEVKDAAKQKASEAVDNAADAAKKSLGL